MDDERYEYDEFPDLGEPEYSPPVRPRRRPRPQRPRGSTAVMTVRLTALSVVAAAVIGGGLAVQMAAGSDPALGPKQAKAVKASAKTRSNGAAAQAESTDSTAQTGSSGDSSSGLSSDSTSSQSTPSQVTPTQVAPTQSSPAPVTSSVS
jgi:cytoskeletal protein RodZ